MALDATLSSSKLKIIQKKFDWDGPAEANDALWNDFKDALRKSFLSAVDWGKIYSIVQKQG